MGGRLVIPKWAIGGCKIILIYTIDFQCSGVESIGCAPFGQNTRINCQHQFPGFKNGCMEINFLNSKAFRVKAPSSSMKVNSKTLKFSLQTGD